MRNEEILNMVKEGTITVEEGARLLEAMGEETLKLSEKNNKPKMMRVFVDAEDEKDGPVKVRVNLPVSLLKLGSKMGKGVNINGVKIDEYVDIDEVLKAVDNGEMGEIISVDSEEAKVRVVIE